MDLATTTANHWKELRGRTYDLIDLLTVDDIGLQLNFERSQSIGYQLWCMLGAQESWIPLIETGKWQGFSCSVSSLKDDDVIQQFKRQMAAADEKLLKALISADLTREFDDGKSPFYHYMSLVEHESHHQGQLINFIYAHDLPIPRSWEEKWALRRD